MPIPFAKLESKIQFNGTQIHIAYDKENQVPILLLGNLMDFDWAEGTYKNNNKHTEQNSRVVVFLFS